ncbi:hypothetical protein KUTeg_006686 [Tegillarca granosa]|uniref:Uncharacterized protein n=1 Tax=Tegillarca granosa TaxID=220873 RepID=A0ABQ9FD24_TEGGR|nr:hypothetical protein KUTeg_006686 [Tegillarca granosa]
MELINFTLPEPLSIIFISLDTSMEMASYNVSSNNTQPESTDGGNIYSHTINTSRKTIENKTNEHKKGRSKLQLAIFNQLFGVCLFVLGLVAGILIGIYAFHGTRCEQTNNKSSSLDPLKGAQSSSQSATTLHSSASEQSKVTVPTTISNVQSTITPCRKCAWQNPVYKPTYPEKYNKYKKRCRSIY